MNFYEHHLGDYTRDTVHLTMLEDGAYRRLLDRIYTTERGIPVDQAHRLARASSPEEVAAVDAVLAEFFKNVDGVYVQARAAAEIEKARKRIAVSRENGKKSGGRPRKPENETRQEPGRNPAGTRQVIAGLVFDNLDHNLDKPAPDSNLQSPISREQIQKAPKKVEKKVASDLPPIPPELDTEEFRAAWAERIEERREARKPIKPTQAKRQFKLLVKVADLKGSDFAAQLVRAASANETLGVVWADQLARWRRQAPQHQILGGGLPLIDGDLSL